MTESEWLNCEDPARILKCIKNGLLPGDDLYIRPFNVSERKLRLFACATARLLADRPPHPERTAVLEACEQIADGKQSKWGAGSHGLAEARKSIGAVWGWVWAGTCENINYGLDDTLIQMRGNAGSFYRQDEVSNLIRDIVSNPFQVMTFTGLYGASITVGPQVIGSCLQQLAPHWFTPTVLGIANHIYDTSDFAALPVLSDALEEAGCDSEEILKHCRGQERNVCGRCSGDGKAHGADRLFEWSADVDYGKCVVCKGTGIGGWRPFRGHHVRGCWVLDFFLGKE